MKNTNILIVVIAAVLISCSYRVNAQGCNARSCTLASDCYSDSQCNSNCQGNQCTTSTLNCTNTTKPYCYRPPIIGNPSCEDCTTDSHCVSKNSSLPYCTGAGGGNNRCVQCTSNTDCITKDDCGATCSATGACTPSGNPARNCTKYQYGNCIQSGGVMICSGECDPNANACNVLYAGKKNLCVANGTTGTYICQGCTDALCQSEGDCGATCNVTNGTCIPSGNPTLNCTNQSLVCNYQNRVCAECNNDTMCVLKSLNNGAACARPNGGGGGQTPRCVECTGGNSCVSNDHCNGNCQTGVCTGGTNCTAINRVCTGRVCAQCASNADCTNSSQPICNGGTCAQCGSNADCSVYCGGQCNNNVCTGTICQPGFQCSGGGFGLCVGIYNGCPFTCPNASLPFCRTQPSYACVECTNDAQCITKTGVCSATCTNNACSVGANITCNASSSKPVCNTATGTCVECETNNDCQNASLSRCDTTGIAPSYTCKACITDAQCTNSSACSGSTCTNFVCVTNGGCNCSANAVAKVCRNNQYCAECATAADCAAPRSLCTNFGKCVQCNADADCRSATNCNAVCSDDGLCTNPTSALDCTKATNNPSATCSTTEGTCIQCLNNNDCTGVAGKTYCNTNTQKCVACTANTQCRGTYCDSVCLNFSCVDGTTNCGANSQICNIATGKCSQCYADGDCTTSPNLFCNSVGVCSACKQDTHCQADNKCNARCETSSGTCYFPGNKTLDCTATGAVCIVATGSGACRECADDGDCSGSKPFCTGGRCSQCRPPVGTVTYLQDCRSNSNCNSTCVLNTTSNGYYCNAGGLACVNQTVCTISGGLCVECLANTDCTSSSKPYCLASAGKCVECSNNTQCDTGSTCGASCVGGTCERAAAATCASGTFCKAGSCVECLTSANCPNGQPCSNNGVCGVCSNTAACKSDSVCAGIQCIDSKCQQVNGSTILDCTAQSKKCDTANSRCVDCFTATDCPTSKPNCVTGTCTECTTDTQCRKNTNCNAVCSASYTCVNPVAAVDCSPQVCNTATATCAECSTTANCDSDSNCGRTCSNGQCGGIGSACTGSTSHCSNAKCVACTIAAHCGSGYTCTNNQCVVCTNNCPAPPSSSVPMYASLVTLLSLVVSLLVRSA